MRAITFGMETRDDVFGATQTIRETFYGLGGDDSFLFFNGESPDSDPDFSDRFIGGNGDDLMSNLFVGINDYTTYNLLSFDGGAGYDTVRYDASGVLDTASIAMDLWRFSTLERSVEHHLFNIDLQVSNSPVGDVSINGKDGDETVQLNMASSSGQTVDDTVFVNVDLGDGADRFDFVGDWDVKTVLRVKTAAGNDTIVVNETSTVNSNVPGSRINAGNGNDLVVLEGMHKETVRLGAGNDTVYLLSGGFAEVPDKIVTGGGRDRIYLELDEYSTMARITDFNAARDRIVFDADEFRDTGVTFSKAVADAATEPMLFMNNKTDKLFFGDSLLAVFTSDVDLTAANFDTDTFLF